MRFVSRVLCLKKKFYVLISILLYNIQNKTGDFSIYIFEEFVLDFMKKKTNQDLNKKSETQFLQQHCFNTTK